MKKKLEIKNDLKNVLKLMGSNRKPYFMYMILLAVSDAFLDMAFSYMTKSMVDYFVDQVPNSIQYALVSVAVVVVFGGILLPVYIYFTNKLNAKTLNDVRLNFFDHLQEMPAAYFEGHHSGDTLARVNKDINALDTALRTIERFTIVIVRMLLFIPYILVLDYRFGLIAFSIGVVAMFFNIKFRLPMRERSRKIHERNAELTEQLTDNVTGFNVIKTYGLSEIFNDKYAKRLDNVMKSQLKISWTNAFLYSSNAMIWWVGYGGIGVIGSYFVITGSMLAGTLMGGLFIASSISRSLVEIGEMIATVQKSFAGSDRIYEILNEPKEPESYGTTGEGCDIGVSIEDGNFAYEDGIDVIKGLDISVMKGDTAALVGYSGGGKSTVVKLILGLYELRSGRMCIDGKGLNEYTLEEVRDRTAYVPQDAYVFNGTIRENILYGNISATDEEIESAARKANAHDFIMGQKDGYDTVVGERGIRLSGGQRQRVAIARAILKDAPILLLDEATSSLDSESEYLVQEALEELMRGRTSIVVAHRLSTIENADIIYFISDGKVVEEGTNDELLAMGGRYRELYDREFITEEMAYEIGG